MEEAVLIQRARQGDQVAWVSLVGEHQEVIFRLAYLIVGDPEDARDVAQETFIRAFRGLHRFDEGRPLRPWLLRIASNLARNQRRSWGRYWAALSRFIKTDGEKHKPGADETLSNRVEAQMLWEAVRQLRRADQEVIYFRYFLELTVDETAQALQVAPGTVKSRLHRGLGRLKDVISQEFPGLREE